MARKKRATASRGVVAKKSKASRKGRRPRVRAARRGAYSK